ncbi:pentatricopeptide repeat-containing protein At3g16610 [Impatiens glandulifera]|uniref:pentatricopeptide repeat-containing protein At3g16610 n=1 Tax=Impatiens glandulifera TaxID=253017 RepID=UPI001FB10CC5|nr:pentatricopeptide repeat-containing protein At3g16610 [Impatiens glandulifera]
MSCRGPMLETIHSKICISSYIKLLEDCIQSKLLKPGKLIHQHFLKNCHHPEFHGDSIIVLEKLSRLYIACNKTALAHQVLDQIPHPEKKNKVSIWNSIIRGYAWEGPFDKAISLYREMLESGVRPNNYTYPFVLKACSGLQAIEDGKEVHEHAKLAGFDSDVYICTALVDFYAKCGSLKEAREVFDAMPMRDVVAWNAIIAGFSLHGLYDDVIRLIFQMQEAGLSPNSSTIVSVLPAVGESSALVQGKALHAYGMKKNFHNDVMVATGLIDMYGKCACLSYASRIFDALSFKNEVTWSAMIGSCIACGYLNEALKLFEKRLLNDSTSLSVVTLGAILRLSAMLTDLGRGRSIHGLLIKIGFVSDLMLANTLLSMYAKCGILSEAEAWFNEMVNKDAVSYSAFISGCTQSGYAKEALVVFKKMQLSGIQPDSATMVGVLPACSQLAALQHGISCHGYSVMQGFTENISICNALIDMYSKCGKLHAARLVFDGMHTRDIVSWNTMIFGYGIHGHGNEAVKLFHDLQKSRISPDDMSFISVLSACSHSGLVSEGRMLFHSMTSDYHINPRMEHYVCMVDLLGRVGELDEAYRFIQRMPIDPDVRIWSALLSGCKVYKNIELGEKVAFKIQSIGPESTGNFVLLSNMYSDAGRWNDAADARIAQRNWGFKKIPGCSWVEINRVVHGFVGGDRSHARSEEIYKKLGELLMEMKKMGYNNSLGSGFVMQDVEEEEKESILLYHSEKLAVAFALLSLPASNNKPILINKNLRVCGDCHAAFKYISIISNREITVRDASRFHHFRDGICNCRDFW